MDEELPIDVRIENLRVSLEKLGVNTKDPRISDKLIDIILIMLE